MCNILLSKENNRKSIKIRELLSGAFTASGIYLHLLMCRHGATQATRQQAQGKLTIKYALWKTWRITNHPNPPTPPFLHQTLPKVFFWKKKITWILNLWNSNIWTDFFFSSVLFSLTPEVLAEFFLLTFPNDTASDLIYSIVHQCCKSLKWDQLCSPFGQRVEFNTEPCLGQKWKVKVLCISPQDL